MPIQKTPEAATTPRLRTAGWAKSSLAFQPTATRSRCIQANSSLHMRWLSRIPPTPELRTLEAMRLLGHATVLSKRGAARDALSKQTEASHSAGPV